MKVESESARNRTQILKRVPVFAGLGNDALSILEAVAEPSEFRAGEVIVREGEQGNRMFIIESGKVEVIKHLGEPHETVLDVLGDKNFIGEMSIVDCVVRSATVRAIMDTRLLSLKGIDLYRLFQKHPDQYAIVILNIARDLARRLRSLDERFAAISH